MTVASRVSVSCVFPSHSNRFAMRAKMTATNATRATEAVAPFMRRKEAAAALGFSRQRLEKLIKQGRIEETEAGIDIERARQALARTTDVARQAAYRMRTGIKATPRSPSSSPHSKPAQQDPEDGELFDFTRARAEKEAWNARHAEQVQDACRGSCL